MKRKKISVTRDQKQEAIVRLENVLVEAEYLLPCSPGQITDDDLAFYGAGKTRTYAELKENVEQARLSRDRGRIPQDREAAESLAMAARNGDQISKAVWDRMRSDRESAEQDAGDEPE